MFQTPQFYQKFQMKPKFAYSFNFLLIKLKLFQFLVDKIRIVYSHFYFINQDFFIFLAIIFIVLALIVNNFSSRDAPVCIYRIFWLTFRLVPRMSIHCCGGSACWQEEKKEKKE